MPLSWSHAPNIVKLAHISELKKIVMIEPLYAILHLDLLQGLLCTKPLLFTVVLQHILFLGT
jgi:hypothetical protein